MALLPTTQLGPVPATPRLPPSQPRSGHVQLCVINNTILFFQERDGPWLPTLRILHQYPEMMKRLRADKGAIKFVLSGANIMCPGLTHPDATIHDEVGTSLERDLGLWCTVHAVQRRDRRKSRAKV